MAKGGCAPGQTEQAKQQAASRFASIFARRTASAVDCRITEAFARRTGDLDEMVKSRNIRALVLLNPIGFFYDKGQPQG